MCVDSGSQITALPRDLAVKTSLEIQSDCTKVLKVYGGLEVPVVGVLKSVVIKDETGESAIGDIFVGDAGTQSILGMNYIRALIPELESNPICNPVICNETDRFTASFRLKTDASLDGMCYPARSLPFSMKAMVETELKRLLTAGIIYPVHNPVASCSIVPVLKPAGSARPIRICGDYSLTLNKIIDPDRYKLPKLEEILQSIPNSKYYSVIDLEDAYLQMALTEESQKLTCISTHIGNFAFKTMQFGISAAPLIFQEVMDKVLRGIPNVASYQDDIIIGTATLGEHKEILSRVKEHLATHGFKINSRKSQEFKTSVKFLGFLLQNGRLLPDPDRSKTLHELPEPRDKEQLRSVISTLRH